MFILGRSGRIELLRRAAPLVKTYGFTREALSRSVLHLPNPHKMPLSEAAVTSIFGKGDNARKRLVRAWMEIAVDNMIPKHSPASLLELLESRLKMNEPVLEHLPGAFALLAEPVYSNLAPLHLSSVLRHSFHIAEEACTLTSPYALGPAWHRRCAAVAMAYSTAELVQLTRPESSDVPYKVLKQYLNKLLEVTEHIEEVGLFGEYVGRSWAGIGKSNGL